MEQQPGGTDPDDKANIVKEIIPGASPELVREVVEDQLGHTVPAPASEEVELERIRRAQAADDKP
jgi:hypothetical protein